MYGPNREENILDPKFYSKPPEYVEMVFFSLDFFHHLTSRVALRF
jgi:hypothetical protein